MCASSPVRVLLCPRQISTLTVEARLSGGLVFGRKIMRKCSKCSIEKSVSEFYISRGKMEWRCKQCRSAYFKTHHTPPQKTDLQRAKWRAWNKAKYQGNKEKILKKLEIESHTVRGIARKKLRNAVSNGKIIKPLLCQDCCKQTLLHGHHVDYSRPFDVLWLCPLCHSNRHGKLNASSRAIDTKEGV